MNDTQVALTMDSVAYICGGTACLLSETQEEASTLAATGWPRLRDYLTDFNDKNQWRAYYLANLRRAVELLEEAADG